MTDTNVIPPRLVGITDLDGAVVLASTLNAWLSLHTDSEISDDTRAMANHLFHRLKARAEHIADDLDAELNAEPPHPRHEDAPVIRQITMDELGPQAQEVARHAIAIGADRVSISTMGTHYWRGDIELQRPGETYRQLGDRIDPRN